MIRFLGKKRFTDGRRENYTNRLGSYDTVLCFWTGLIFDRKIYLWEEAGEIISTERICIGLAGGIDGTDHGIIL